MTAPRRVCMTRPAVSWREITDTAVAQLTADHPGCARVGRRRQVTGLVSFVVDEGVAFSSLQNRPLFIRFCWAARVRLHRPRRPRRRSRHRQCRRRCRRHCGRRFHLPVGTQLLRRARQDRHDRTAERGQRAPASLLRHGVRYPGRRYNHRRAAVRPASTRSPAGAAAARRLGRAAGRDRCRSGPSGLDQQRVHCRTGRRHCGPVLVQLGRSTHVVITLRSFGALLPSIGSST